MSDSESHTYLHGYTATEQDRLRRQARFLEPAVFRDIDYPARSA